MSSVPWISLAFKSLWSRRGTALLIVLSMAVGVALVIGVEKLRQGAQAGFANTVSGTDLVVGARSGSVNLLLYSVFRVGNATANVSWSTYQKIAEDPDVAWTIPLSLGDSHKGYRVIGTERSYFEHYRFAGRQFLTFAQGKAFDDLFDVVLGAEVAKALGYKLGDKIIITHGIGDLNARDHDDKPFRISGILAPTGTPVDRSLHVSLAGIEAMHIDWDDGAPKSGFKISAERLRKLKLKPKSITAFMVGLKSRFAVFGLQRTINTDPTEPLLAILPGVALQELWDVMRPAEWALRAISGLVAISAILGMLAMLLAGLAERRREIAILRAVGARPWHLILLITTEAVGLVAAGIITGLILLFASFSFAAEWIATSYGIRLQIWSLGSADLIYFAVLIGLGFIAGLIPALLAYRRSLADGLLTRL